MTILKEFNVGCIGASPHTDYHINGWSRIENADITAFCCEDMATAKGAVRERTWITLYTNVEEMLKHEELDIIDIMTPSHTHVQLIELAMEYDVHVILPKSFSATDIHFDTISQMAKDYSKHIIIHENFRWMPWYNELVDLVNYDMIGAPHYINHRVRVGGAEHKLSSPLSKMHFIDLFRTMMGDITEVYSRVRKSSTSFVDQENGCIIQFEFANGGLGLIDTCFDNKSGLNKNPYTYGTTIIEGSEGSIALAEDGTITLQNLNQEASNVAYYHEDYAFGGDCTFLLQQHIISALSKRLKPANTIEDYMMILNIQRAIRRSAQSKQVVSIQNVDPPRFQESLILA